MFRKIALILLPVFLFSSCALFRKHEKQPTENSPQKGRLWGIDISHYQKIESWSKIKEHAPAFIFVKATEGSTWIDPDYATNYQQIRKQGIAVGSYHFFSYKSNGKDQALNFLKVANYKKGDLPLVLDVEYATKMPEKSVIVKEVLAFIDVLVEKTRRHPVVYCDYKFYLRYLKESLPVKCKLWIVDYRGRPDCNWTFWQTTDRYTVAGIKGFVDFNYFNGSVDDLKKLLY